MENARTQPSCSGSDSVGGGVALNLVCDEQPGSPMQGSPRHVRPGGTLQAALSSVLLFW